MGWAARIGWGLLGLGVAGCGDGVGAGSVRPEPAAVSIADRCTVEGVQIEVEEGVLGGFGGESPCTYSGRYVAVWRRTYEERWGAIPLESWTVRIRTPERVDARGRSGLTWYDQRLVEVSQLHFELLPHELHHAQLGEASTDHHGWCADFVPWELERHIQDERAALGCGS
jgi:hypothetical protein